VLSKKIEICQKLKIGLDLLDKMVFTINNFKTIFLAANWLCAYYFFDFPLSSIKNGEKIKS